MLPKTELRGQPFTMRPDMEVHGNGLQPSTSVFIVTAPGFEDWTSGSQEIIIRAVAWHNMPHTPTAWRAYVRETITGYDTSFGRGGQTIHNRFHAIRDVKTGNPLGSRPSKETMLAALQELFLAEEVMPA